MKKLWLSFLKWLAPDEPSFVTQPDAVIPPPAISAVHAEIVPPHVSLVPQFCLGLFSAEGGKNAAGYIHNNPGDLRHSPYTASLGATGATPEGFCIFPDMGTGIRATQQLVTDACHGLLIDYKPSESISQFCATYAQPPVLENYVNKVLTFLPTLKAETPISQLL